MTRYLITATNTRTMRVEEFIIEHANRRSLLDYFARAYAGYAVNAVEEVA